MSDMREETGTQQVPRQTRGPERTTPAGSTDQPLEFTAWAGWVYFGALVMILLGTFQAIAGLVALLDNSYYHATSNGLLVHANYTAWGWLHLIVGLVAIAAGVGLFTGRMWARITGVVVAMVSAIVNIGFLAAYPIWAVTMITLDAIVIYAICAHGR
ncbi:MAG: DUF7144 family membrane protein, partial [Mycobacteriaceae bacterium]